MLQSLVWLSQPEINTWRRHSTFGENFTCPRRNSVCGILRFLPVILRYNPWWHCTVASMISTPTELIGTYLLNVWITASKRFGMSDEKQMKAVLLLVCGAQTSTLLKNLTISTSIGELKYSELLEVLLDHCNPYPISYCPTFQFLYEPSGNRAVNLQICSWAQETLKFSASPAPHWCRGQSHRLKPVRQTDIRIHDSQMTFPLPLSWRVRT